VDLFADDSAGGLLLPPLRCGMTTKYKRRFPSGMTSKKETRHLDRRPRFVRLEWRDPCISFFALATLEYRGFSATQDDEACPAPVEMTDYFLGAEEEINSGLSVIAGETNADSSAALRNDNEIQTQIHFGQQKRQMQIPPLSCGMTTKYKRRFTSGSRRDKCRFLR
jgi:hypothetical protein